VLWLAFASALLADFDGGGGGSPHHECSLAIAHAATAALEGAALGEGCLPLVQAAWQALVAGLKEAAKGQSSAEIAAAAGIAETISFEECKHERQLRERVGWIRAELAFAKEKAEQFARLSEAERKNAIAAAKPVGAILPVEKQAVAGIEKELWKRVGKKPKKKPAAMPEAELRALLEQLAPLDEARRFEEVWKTSAHVTAEQLGRLLDAFSPRGRVRVLGRVRCRIVDPDNQPKLAARLSPDDRWEAQRVGVPCSQ
jgi:hypothetical protein